MKTDPEHPVVPPPGGEAPPAELQFALEKFRMEQNLALGIVAGFIAAVVGAALWAVVTGITGYQIGWMAVAIGFLVGFAVRAAGKGLDRVFGVVGALLSLFGCALGNLLAVVYMISVQQDSAFVDVLRLLDAQTIIDLLITTFQPMDIVFYVFAVYFGYRLSFRQISQAELSRAMGKSI